MIIAIGSDHTALELRHAVKEHLESCGHMVNDLGTHQSTRTDYPLQAKAVAHAIQAGEADKGVLICGTGIGMAMAATKFNGIRAASVSEPYSAKMAVEHNNANIICFGARVVGDELAKMIVDTFFNATYQEGRHARRVALIDSYE